MGSLAIQSCECLIVICSMDIKNKSLDTWNYHHIKMKVLKSRVFFELKYIQVDPYSSILILQICSFHICLKLLLSVSIFFWIVPLCLCHESTEKSSHTNNVKVTATA